MSWGERAEARAERAVEARRARLIAAVAGELGSLGGMRVSARPDAVVIEGRGLAKRWLEDPRLRFGASGR